MADELRYGCQFAAVCYGAAISPVEDGLYLVVFGLGFQSDIHRAGCFPVSKADFCLELFARIFAENHSRFKELFSVAQSREVTFHAQALRFVVEVAFQRGVGIYFQRYLEYGGQYLRIVDVQVEIEVVFGFPRFLVRQYQGGDVTPHDVEYAGRQGLIGVVPFDSASQEVGIDSQPFLTLVILSGGNPQVVHEEALVGSGVLQAVNVDFTVHVVNGTSGEVGFYLYGYFRVLVFGSKMKGVRTEMVDIGAEVECRDFAGCVDGAVQLYGAVLVVE